MNVENVVLDEEKTYAAPQIRGSWMSRFLRMFSSRNPASRSHRYLARQIDADLADDEKGHSIVFGSPGSMRMSTESLLMFSYFMQDELGCKVLLVDATFRDDGVASRLGHAGSPGFMELMHDSTHELNRLIRPTNRRNIFLLPAGNPPADGFLPLKAETIQPLLSSAAERFDYILIQQGSILQDTRYLLFTSLVDLVILLVEEGVSRVSELEDCQNLFRDYQVSNFRFVISK